MCGFAASLGWFGLQSCANIPSKNIPEALRSCDTRRVDPFSEGRQDSQSFTLPSFLRETSSSSLSLLLDSCDTMLFLISTRQEEGFAVSVRRSYAEIGRVTGLSFVDLALTESCRVAFPYSWAHFLNSDTSSLVPGCFIGGGIFVGF